MFTVNCLLYTSDAADEGLGVDLGGRRIIKKKESGAGFGFKISTEIIAALVVGVGIGLIVDNYFNTKPIGLIIFFIFGALAGFLNVYRVMRRIEKQR